jgi:hypothetical protein
VRDTHSHSFITNLLDIFTAIFVFFYLSTLLRFINRQLGDIQGKKLSLSLSLSLIYSFLFFWKKLSFTNTRQEQKEQKKFSLYCKRFFFRAFFLSYCSEKSEERKRE